METTMRSDMSKLAQKIWSELQPLIFTYGRVEAAQRLVDLFEEAGCTDMCECVQLIDIARASILDDDKGLELYAAMDPLEGGDL